MTGEEFEDRREELGWTQYFLAEKLGVPRSSVAHWEQNRAPVPKNVARAMRFASRTMKKLGSGMWRELCR